MSEEKKEFTIEPEKFNSISARTDTAATAFWMQNIDNEVDVLLETIGWITIRVVDVSQYVIIAYTDSEPFNGRYVELSKKHIIAVKSSDEFNIDEYDALMFKGIKAIIVNESQARKKKLKEKAKFPIDKKPFKPQVVEDKPSAPVTVITKKKRELTFPMQ